MFHKIFFFLQISTMFFLTLNNVLKREPGQLTAPRGTPESPRGGPASPETTGMRGAHPPGVRAAGDAASHGAVRPSIQDRKRTA